MKVRVNSASMRIYRYIICQTNWQNSHHYQKSTQWRILPGWWPSRTPGQTLRRSAPLCWRILRARLGGFPSCAGLRRVWEWRTGANPLKSVLEEVPTDMWSLVRSTLVFTTWGEAHRSMGCFVCVCLSVLFWHGRHLEASWFYFWVNNYILWIYYTYRETDVKFQKWPYNAYKGTPYNS